MFNNEAEWMVLVASKKYLECIMELVKPTVTGYVNLRRAKDRGTFRAGYFEIFGVNIEDGYILMGIAIVMLLTVCYFVGTGM